MLATRYAAILNSWNGEPDPKLNEKLSVLRGLTRDVALMQRTIRLAHQHTDEYHQHLKDEEAREKKKAKDRLLAPIWAAQHQQLMQSMLGPGEEQREAAEILAALAYDLPLPKKRAAQPSGQGASNLVKPTDPVRPEPQASVASTPAIMEHGQNQAIPPKPTPEPPNQESKGRPGNPFPATSNNPSEASDVPAAVDPTQESQAADPNILSEAPEISVAAEPVQESQAADPNILSEASDFPVAVEPNQESQAADSNIPTEVPDFPTAEPTPIATSKPHPTSKVSPKKPKDRPGAPPSTFKDPHSAPFVIRPPHTLAELDELLKPFGTPPPNRDNE